MQNLASFTVCLNLDGSAVWNFGYLEIECFSEQIGYS